MEDTLGFILEKWLTNSGKFIAGSTLTVEEGRNVHSLTAHTVQCSERRSTRVTDNLMRSCSLAKLLLGMHMLSLMTRLYQLISQLSPMSAP